MAALKFWYECDLQLLRERYSNTSSSEIAKALDRPLETVERKARALGLRKRPESLRDGPDGAEKYCSSCEEWWPADLEFFYRDPSGAGRLFHCCKACYVERFRPRGVKQVEQLAAPGQATAALAGLRLLG